MWYRRAAVAAVLFSLLAFMAILGTRQASAVVPTNDNLANAENVSGLPFSSTIADNTDATRQTGEPQCNFITDTVWYKYSPSGNTTLSADTTGSLDIAGGVFDTVLAVFTGPASSPTFPSLTLVACNDGANTTSQVVFAATAGTTYYFQAGGLNNEVGSLKFNLAVSAVVPPTNDNFLSAANASPLPYSNSRSTAGAALEPGEQRPLCGNTFPQFGATVWYKSVAVNPGTFTANAGGFDTMLAAYTGSSLPALTMIGCDDDGGPGPASLLTLSATSGTTYYFQAGGFDNATGTLAFGLTFTPSADSDNDGWSDTAESIIGTNPTLACGVNAWPADIDNDGFVDTGDITAVTGNFGLSVPPGQARADIAPDPPNGFVDTVDIVRLTNLFGLGC